MIPRVSLHRISSDGGRLRTLTGEEFRPLRYSRFKYGDADSAEAALRGASSLFLVSGREAPDRVGEHRTMIDAAVRAGVGRIVYLSFLGAAPDCTFTFGRDHFHTEQASAYVYLNDGGPILFKHEVLPYAAVTRPATKSGSFRVYKLLNEVHSV